MLFAAWFTLTAGAFAQDRLIVGAIAGTNLTNDVRSGTAQFPGGLLPSGETSSSTFIVAPGARRPILGLRLGYRLSDSWELEADALHREWKSTETMIISPPLELPDGRKLSTFGPSTRLLTPWEFPVLARYAMKLGPVRPFLLAGPSFRPAGSGTGLSHTGITAGGGIDILAGSVRISPAVRYTRWSAANVGFTLGAGLQNQVELLAAVEPRSGPSVTGILARRLSLGLIAGAAPGKDFRVGSFEQNQISESNGTIIGLMIEASIAGNWAVEADGLYRPLHGTDLEFNRRVRFAHLTWEFPVLAKYRIPVRSKIRPFVVAGPAFRAEGNLNLKPVSHYGAAAGAGVEAKWHWLKVAPALRYTRWAEGARQSAASQTWANELQLLVSFAF